LPGIGPKLASRINSFREKLGGFYSIDQVAETYGLPDSTFQKIRPYLKFSGEVKKINVNRATREELSSHPYIRWKMAGAITEYRKQHGDFAKLEDLKKVFLVDDAAFLKMLPYLSL
jgi:competence ComEA-like helix-hairpin-helix protein